MPKEGDTAAAKTTLVDIFERYRDDVCPTKRGGSIERLKINKWLRQEFARTQTNQLAGRFWAENGPIQRPGRYTWGLKRGMWHFASPLSPRGAANHGIP